MIISRAALFPNISGGMQSSATFNGKTYLGNYGGHLISGPPWADIWTSGGEAILDICVFNNQLWIAVEGVGLFKMVNDTPTLMFSGTVYHLAVFNNELYFTHATSLDDLALSKITIDGSLIHTYNIASTGSFLYYVASIGSYLILGTHSGEPYAGTPAQVLYSTDGFNFSDWSGVTGLEPVYRAYYWSGYYYFGTWSIRSANRLLLDNYGFIYRTIGPGEAVTKVLASGKSQITAFKELDLKLYALASAGFNYVSGSPDAAETELYESSDGSSWTKIHTFLGDPEVTTMSPLLTGMAFGGGYFGEGWSSVYVTNEVVKIPITPPEDAVAQEIIQAGEYKIYVSWVAAVGAHGYEVMRVVDGVADEASLISTTLSNHWDSGLGYHQYSYLVRAYFIEWDDFSDWIISNVVTPSMGIANKYLPVNLMSELLVNCTIELQWDWISPCLNPAQHFIIEYSVDDGNYSTLALVDLISGYPEALLNHQEYIHTNPQVGHKYSYRVRVEYLTWVSGRVSFPSITIVHDPRIPLEPPLNIKALFNGSNAVITWQDNTKMTLKHIVECAIFSSIGSTLVDWTQLEILNPGIEFFTDYSASPGKIQQYRVCSLYQELKSGYSYTEKIPGMPLQPTNLLVVAGDTSISLTWEAVITPNPIVDYLIERRVSIGIWVYLTRLTHALLETLLYEDTTVELNQFYSYRISSSNGAGTSLPSMSSPNVKLTIPLFTSAYPVRYKINAGVAKTIVVGKEGSGQLHNTILGLASLYGYTWYTDEVGVGTLIAGVKSIDLITNKFGGRLVGGKTLYSVEFTTDCPEEIIVTAFSRKPDGKFHRVDESIHSPEFGRARLIVSGPEFKLRIQVLGGSPKVFTIDKAVAWLKTTDKRGFNTIPQIIEREKEEDKNI